jgi:hypothetical protein
MGDPGLWLMAALSAQSLQMEIRVLLLGGTGQGTRGGDGRRGCRSGGHNLFPSAFSNISRLQRNVGRHVAPRRRSPTMAPRP